MQESSTSSSHKQTQREDDLLELNLPLLIALISQIYHSTKVRGYWKSLSFLRTLPEKYNTIEYCDYHQDHGHHTEDFQKLKSFILKLIDKNHLKEFIVLQQHMAQ